MLNFNVYDRYEKGVDLETLFYSIVTSVNISETCYTYNFKRENMTT